MYIFPSDLNECISGANDCDKHAECINTIGSFKCLCMTGYTGSGTHCQGTCTDYFIITLHALVVTNVRGSLVPSPSHPSFYLAAVPERKPRSQSFPPQLLSRSRGEKASFPALPTPAFISQPWRNISLHSCKIKDWERGCIYLVHHKQ